MPKKEAYIYWTHACVAEFGEQTIVVIASSGEEANAKAREWCKKNFHELSSKPLKLEMWEASPYTLVDQEYEEALFAKLDEEASELEEFEGKDYDELFNHRDGLLWRTRAILAENYYKKHHTWGPMKRSTSSPDEEK